MLDNTDFTVIAVLGPQGVGKSTILNELYGFDGNSPDVLPPFGTQSEETNAMARHCSVGIEVRMSAERFILLDTQLHCNTLQDATMRCNNILIRDNVLHLCAMARGGLLQTSSNALHDY
eukprot:c23479_g3_i2 orf=1002-1358(+)